MKALKSIIVDQLGLVLEAYRPFKDLLDPEGREDFKQLKHCLKKLKKKSVVSINQI